MRVSINRGLDCECQAPRVFARIFGCEGAIPVCLAVTCSPDYPKDSIVYDHKTRLTGNGKVTVRLPIPCYLLGSN